VQEQEALHQLNRRTVFRVLRNNYVDPKAPKKVSAQPKVRKGYYDDSEAEEPVEDEAPLEDNRR
jgi:hypothetical protein